MIEEDAELEAMAYTSDKPDVNELVELFRCCTNELEDYRQQTERNYDDRRNLWSGKTDDLRKGGAQAFPWPGASDQEAHVVGERMDTLVAMCMAALGRSHIKAYAVKMASMPRASTVSAFVKWMIASYIPGFRVQQERACNHLFEKAMAVTYVGWERRERTYRQEMGIEAIRQAAPEVADMIEAGEDDDVLADMLTEQWPKLRTAKAKKAIRDLRTKGVAEIVVSRSTLMDSRPVVMACSPDCEVLFPPWCADPEQAPYCFWRKPMTVQEIESKVATEGWDRDWADEMINNYRGVGIEDSSYSPEWRDRTSSGTVYHANSDLILVVLAYQRLIDDDGSEGIYCTAFNPYYTGANADAPAYAKRELYNGYRGFPFVVTRLDESSDRMYDQQAIPERLRSAQRIIKAERDSRVDRNSLANCPPQYGPAGKQVAEWGPGKYIPMRRPGERGFMDPPAYNPGSVEMEQTMDQLADKIVGLNVENPLSQVRQKFWIDKTLEHARRVLLMAYTRFQQFGPDQVFFNVTGTPDPITMDNVEDDEFDLTITFDSLANDPETMEARAKMMASLMQMDPTGRIDKGRFIEFLTYSIDPAFAEAILLPAEENQQKLAKAITDDFTKLWSGIEIGPQPNGAQAALQMGQAWMQQPDVSARMEGDEAFRARTEKYFEQVQFQLTQAENATIGRIGTAPAQFQGTNVGP